MPDNVFFMAFRELIAAVGVLQINNKYKAL